MESEDAPFSSARHSLWTARCPTCVSIQKAQAGFHCLITLWPMETHLDPMRCQAGAKQVVSYLSLRTPRLDRWWGGIHGAV